MMKILNSVVVIAALLSVSACGDQPGERAVSGAGIGAATGAVGGALLGDPLAGAAIGAAGGAAVGGLTNSSTIDLGKPIWK